MIWTVTTKDKTERDTLLKEVNSWKDNKNLAYPNINSVKGKGKKVEIDAWDTDSYKIITMLARRGFSID